MIFSFVSRHFARYPFRLVYLLWFAATSAIGCSQGPVTYEFSGAVSYLDQPISDGQILFVDPTGAEPTARAPIRDGRYSVRTTSGTKLVRITAVEETGKTIEGAMGATYPETIDLIPAQYNSASELRITLASDKLQGNDFHLQ